MALSKVDLANMVENVAPSSTIPDVNFKNIIINGDMSQAQRATSASSITSGGYHACDRWKEDMTSAGTWTISQSTTVPTGQGFATSLKMDCTTANGSLSANSELMVQQRLEGQMLQYLKKGTSSAESLILSFWVRSNKTGTYICELQDVDNTRQISKSYTISSADTWEKKTITFAGDTTGALDNDNARSLDCSFYLVAGSDLSSGTLSTTWTAKTDANRAVGQVNLADSTSNEWYITGIQLEAGTSASDFEFLPYDVNEERCKRYYQLIVDGVNDRSIATGVYYQSTRVFGNIFLTKIMRARPSLDLVSGTNYYVTYSSGAADQIDDFTLDNSASDLIVSIQNQSSSGTSGYAGLIRTNSTSAFLGVDAEL